MTGPDHLRPYAGRWVALVRGRVVGVGTSAEAARAAAQSSRPKEQPQVLFVPEHPVLQLPPLLDELRRVVPAGVRLWLVGGAVRDALLRRRVHDMDFVVEGPALPLARQVANGLGGDFYALDPERDVGRVLLSREGRRLTLDFARLRGPDLSADLGSRDFTVNAMALLLSDQEAVIDPLEGEADLKAKLIRACSPTAIADDPVRGVRAVRLAAQLDFRIDRETRAAVRAQAGALAQVSPERRRDEFIRCLGGDRPAACVRALEVLGLMDSLAPETSALRGVAQPPPHTLDVWEHTLVVLTRLHEVLTVLGPVHDVDAASDLTLGLVSVRLGRHRHRLAEHLGPPLSSDRPARWILMLAALFHDVGKAHTRTVEPEGRVRFIDHETVGAQIVAGRLTQLRFSGDEISRAQTIVTHHGRPRQLAARSATPSRRAVYRFFKDTGAAGVDIVLLSLADYLAKFSAGPPPQQEWSQHVDVCAQLLSAYFEHPQESVAPPPLISGHDVMEAFGLAAGPQVGELLEAVREAQAAGEIADRRGALDFVRRRLGEA